MTDPLNLDLDPALVALRDRNADRIAILAAKGATVDARGQWTTILLEQIATHLGVTAAALDVHEHQLATLLDAVEPQVAEQETKGKVQKWGGR